MDSDAKLIISEFVIVFISFWIMLFSAVFTIKKMSENIQILEYRLVSSAYLLFIATWLLVLASTFFHQPNSPDQLGTLAHRVSGISGILGMALLAGAFLLPSIRFSYLSVAYITLLIILYSTIAIITGLTAEQIIGTNTIQVDLSPLAVVSFIAGFLFFVLHFLAQIIRAFRISKQMKTKMFHWSTIPLFIFVMIAAVGITVDRTIKILPIEYGYGGYLIASFLLLGFSYTLTKDINFWFVSSILMYGLVVAEKNSGIDLYRKMFRDTGVDNLLSSFLTAVNISVRSVIKPRKSTIFRELSYEDKVIITAEGEWVVVFLIASAKSLSLASIARFLCVAFEKNFPRKDSSSAKMISIENIGLFEQEVTKIRKIMPL